VALCDRRRTPIRIRVARQGREDLRPYIETGTLATDELADHQPHGDDYIAQAQLKTRGLKRDPPTRDPGPKLCPWCNHARRKGIPQAPGGWHPLPEGKPDRRGSR
jgi:hypothetical protein